MTDYNKICKWIEVLEEVQKVYAYRTIENIITQLKAVKKETEK